MGNPRVLKVPLQEYGYHMEVDVKKDDCNRENIHWHLCKNGNRIGQIDLRGVWTTTPRDASSSIIKEAERLTFQYAGQIQECYLYNKENGAG